MLRYPEASPLGIGRDPSEYLRVTDPEAEEIVQIRLG